jgi:hypothetical protein
MGRIPVEAGYASREVSLDFGKAGTTAHAINQMIAFFNANIRGWDKMISSFREHPIRTSFKVFAGITMPSIILYYLNRDDPRWDEIPQYQKDLFWIIFAGDKIIRIPKPFELGILFGSIPERFLEWLDKRDDTLVKEAMMNAIEAGSPGWIPTAGLPIIEWMTNHSFFTGRQIVPEGKEDVAPQLQYTRWTTSTMKKLGELLGLSPAKMENSLFDITGGLGKYAVSIIDAILEGTGLSPTEIEPSKTWADMPVIKAFVVRSPYGSSGEAVNRFYSTLEKYYKGESLLKDYLNTGDEAAFNKYAEAHPELLFFYDYATGEHYSASRRYLDRVASMLTEVGRQQDEIYKATDMTPDEKRQKLDELDKLKTELAREALSNIGETESRAIQAQIDKVDNMLGKIIEETPVLSIEPPDIYGLTDLNRDYSNILSAVPREDAEALPGISPLVSFWYDRKEAQAASEILSGIPYYQINSNPERGDTFREYYNQWQERKKITDEAELYQYDKRYPNAYLGNMSRQQYALLEMYFSLPASEQSAFLDNNPSISSSPRKSWLMSNPQENAVLALWGVEKLYTGEAYDMAVSLMNKYDIPDTAIPSLSLPPKDSIEGYFKYMEMVEADKNSSWEAKLLLSNDDVLREWLGLKPIDTPVAALELYVKHRGLYDQKDAYSNEGSPDYIPDEDEREKAIEQLKADNPEWVDDMRRIEAITSGADDTTIEEWVARGNVIDVHGAGSNEAKAWLLDHPETHSWALDAGLLTDSGDKWNIPVIRLNVEWAEYDDAYNSISYPDDAARQRNERVQYLDDNPDYRIARYTRDAYMAAAKDGTRFTDTQVQQYVEYYELGEAGYRQERYLVENETFAGVLHKIKGIDIPKPEEVPDVKYDEIYEQYQSMFEQLEGLDDHNSEYYVEYPDERKARRDAMRYNDDGTYTIFGAAEASREAYGLFIPDKHVEAYVSYKEIMHIGKPEGQTLWFDDDWFLMENQEFYNKVYLGILGNERKDFTKVPTKEVYALYQIYEGLPNGKPKYDFRAKYPELDDWLVTAFGLTPIKDRGDSTAGMTPWEESERIKEIIDKFFK